MLRSQWCTTCEAGFVVMCFQMQCLLVAVFGSTRIQHSPVQWSILSPFQCISLDLRRAQRVAFQGVKHLPAVLQKGHDVLLVFSRM